MILSKTSLIILALIVTTASSATGGADVEVTKTGDRVVDANALTIKGRYGQPINGQAFQQNALMSFGGYQYACWYNADRRVCLGQEKGTSLISRCCPRASGAAERELEAQTARRSMDPS